MKRIPLKAEYLPLVASGRKRSTIRAGVKQVTAGKAELVAGADVLPVEITEVVIKRYDELDDEDARRDGFADLTELHAALRRFYPGMTAGDPVSILHFEPSAG